MCMCVLSVYKFVHHEHEVPTSARRGHYVPETRITDSHCSCHVDSGNAEQASTLSPQAIALDPTF